jgi:hypothetical protein
VHQASVNEAPGLLLTIDLMGELVENKEVGRKVAAEEFKGPALDQSAKGGNAKYWVSLYLLRVVWGEWGNFTTCGCEVSASCGVTL